MKIQQKTIFKTNDIKVYDVITHHNYMINRDDVDLKQTVLKGYPDLSYIRNGKITRFGLLFVYPNAIKKTPNYCGSFAISGKAFDKFTIIPKKDW